VYADCWRSDLGLVLCRIILDSCVYFTLALNKHCISSDMYLAFRSLSSLLQLMSVCTVGNLTTREDMNGGWGVCWDSNGVSLAIQLRVWEKRWGLIILRPYCDLWWCCWVHLGCLVHTSGKGSSFPYYPFVSFPVTAASSSDNMKLSSLNPSH